MELDGTGDTGEAGAGFNLPERINSWPPTIAERRGRQGGADDRNVLSSDPVRSATVISSGETLPTARPARRDAVRARLAVIANAIIEFVAEKTAEGYSLAEIDQLYALKLPILFG